ncbi:MAG: putative ABC transporter permease [Bacilli bacterium]|nr:putative ABC transporter permease [Bacilli bacterium]
MKLFNLDKKSTISILMLSMVIGAICGFIYEEIFYLIDLGYLVKRGSTYGPWIPIYAFGTLFIILFSYRFRKNPLLVFIINCISTGILEYGTGFVLHRFFNIRLWDYNTEILNFGNINGYICFRSIALFGCSSLVFIYLLVPMILKLLDKIKYRKFSIISYSLFFIFVFDMILYFIFR